MLASHHSMQHHQGAHGSLRLGLLRPVLKPAPATVPHLETGGDSRRSFWFAERRVVGRPRSLLTLPPAPLEESSPWRCRVGCSSSA